MNYRVALVGAGRIAIRHAELLGGGHVAGLELAAISDPQGDRAKELADKYGVPSFNDEHDMMKSGEKIDLVVVLTPSGLHAKNTIELAPYGKQIIVEKPMALTLDDADKMISACDDAGVRLFVIKQNRFNVPIQKTREALEAGRFGKLILGTVRVRWCRPQRYYDQDAWRGTWAMDGGVLTNQASHHVDVLEWMMGEVDSVYGMATTALADVETEDTAVVTLKFRNGALGIIEATTATRPKDLEGSLSVLGENGTVEVGGFALNQMKTWNFVEEDAEDEGILEEFSVNPPDVYGFGHKSYYEHVVSCLDTGREHLVDGLQGRHSLELITAIYESIETGQEVKLRFRPKWSRLGSESE